MNLKIFNYKILINFYFEINSKKPNGKLVVGYLYNQKRANRFGKHEKRVRQTDRAVFERSQREI